MKKFIIGFVTGWIVIGLGGYLFVHMGGFPVPVKSKPLPLEETIASLSLDHASKGADQLRSPIEPTEKNLIEGAKVYKTNCAFCHGSPGDKELSIAAKGMFPGPPMLFKKEEGMVDYPVGITYWFVKNGIRLTPMPGFSDTLSEEQMWAVSLLLKTADQLPAPVQKVLQGIN